MARHLSFSAPSLIAACALGVACIAPPGASAAEPPAGAEVSSLHQAVQQGAEIFANDRFGGAATCETCHVNGGRTAVKLPNGKEVPSLAGAAAECCHALAADRPLHCGRSAGHAARVRQS